jgi:hypothetical protein
MSEKRRRDQDTAYVDLRQPDAILREVDYIVALAAQMQTRVVRLNQLAFFSTHTGDAWVLDPTDGLALRLADAGGRMSVRIFETDTSFSIGWTAAYHLDGHAFVVRDGSGQRVIYGYPVEELPQAQRRPE